MRVQSEAAFFGEWMLTPVGCRAFNSDSGKAEAIRFLTHKLRYDQDIQNQAAEATIWTKRRMGELLPQPLQHGTNRDDSNHGIVTTTQAAREADIHPADANRYTKLASVPEEKLSAAIEPVVLFQGKILDGRHRHKAVSLLNQAHGTDIAIPYREFTGSETSAMNYVWSANFFRRHLTTAQKAAIGARMTVKLQETVRQGERTDLKQVTSANICRSDFDNQKSSDLVDKFFAVGCTPVLRQGSSMLQAQASLSVQRSRGLLVWMLTPTTAIRAVPPPF